MTEGGQNSQRKDIPYFEGVNSIVSHHVSKISELRHMENARGVQIGSLEKRAGQTVLGTAVGGTPFVTNANYGLFYFDNTSGNQNLYRLSHPNEPLVISPTTSYNVGTKTFSISIADSIRISESINGIGYNTIYSLNTSNEWVALSGNGVGVRDGQISTTVADGNLFFVNGVNTNSYITSDGITVKNSYSAAGHLLNTPLARKINYYKGNLYIADIVVGGVRKNNTVMKSSILLGLLTIVNTDVGASSPITAKVNDTYYFSTTSGSNTYDVYDSNDVYKTTLTVTSFTPTTITATQTGAPKALNVDDNIYVAGSHNGPGRFLWPLNQTPTEKTIKQFSITELSSADGGGITMMTNIGNVMLVGSGSNLTAWNGFTAESFDLNIGCCSDTGFVKLLGSLYFMHYTGVFATSGGVPKIISNKVERYINGATKAGKEASVAGKKGKSVFFTIGDVTLYNPDGSIEKTMNDVCLEYDLIQENWYVHTNIKASNFVTFLEAANSDRLILASTSGNHATKEFLLGETDEGEEIFWRIDLNKLTLNPIFERTNNPIAIVVDTERGSSMKAFVSMVEGSPEYYELDGTIEKGISIIKVHGKDPDRGDPPACRLMDLSFRDSSKQICKIKRASVIFLPGNMDAVIQ